MTAHKELINAIPQEDKCKPNLKPLEIYSQIQLFYNNLLNVRDYEF